MRESELFGFKETRRMIAGHSWVGSKLTKANDLGIGWSEQGFSCIERWSHEKRLMINICQLVAKKACASGDVARANQPNTNTNKRFQCTCTINKSIIKQFLPAR